MASIYERGSRFQVKWRDPDGKQRARTCPNERTAQRFRQEVEEAVSFGRRWQPRDTRPEPELFEICEAYLRDVSRNRQPRTIERYGLHLDVFMRWLRQREGARARLAPSLLSKRLVGEYYDALREFECRNGSRNLDTRRRMVGDVLLAWKWADNDDEYRTVVPRPQRLELAREPGRPTIAPTWKEMSACVFAARGWHRQVAVLLYFTGLRVQQVMMLRWGDFDVERATLNFRGELGKSLHERQGRIMPVSRGLVTELRAWSPTEGFIVQSERARGGKRERMFRARDMARAWARAGVRQDVWRGRPDHAFRKGFVTNLKRAGADIEAVEHLVGHKLPGVRDAYLDPEAHPMRDAVSRIPALSAVLQFRSPTKVRAG